MLPAAYRGKRRRDEDEDAEGKGDAAGAEAASGDAAVQQRLKSLLIKLGENVTGAPVEKKLELMAAALEDDVTGEHKNFVLDLIFQWLQPPSPSPSPSRLYLHHC